MSSHMLLIPSLILLCCLLSSTNSQLVVKSTTLTRSTPSQQGATVSIQSSAEVSGFTDWNIEAIRDDTWHLLLDLDNTWGFHPSKPSTITVEIESDTIPDNTAPITTFDDILLGFSVNNEFIAVRLVMDKDTYKNRISPGCDYIAPYDSYSLKTGDLSTILNGANYRFCPLDLQNTMDCGGSNEYMRDIEGHANINKINNFPIRFTLENHVNDYVILTYQNTQICGFKKGFDTNQGLQIYFAIRDDGMNVNITSFYIEYVYDNSPTPSPTYSPTEVPTYSPTENTPSPTKTTSNPTVPTLTPSHNPSVFPSVFPTYIPSVYPTQNPSVYPTQNPSVYPTHAPIQNVKISVSNSFTKTPSMDRSSAQITSKPTTPPSITSNYLSSNEVGIESKSLPIEYIIFIIMVILISLCFCCLCCICLWRKRKVDKMQKIANTSHSNNIRINMSTPNIANTPKLKDKVISNSIYSAMSKEKQITDGYDEKDEIYKNDDKQNIGLSMIELWLETKVRLPQYYPFFAQNGYDTLDIIKEINDESELIDIGINTQQHIQEIMREIIKLQRLCASDDECKVTPISHENKMDDHKYDDMNDDIMHGITLGDDNDNDDNNNNYIAPHRATLGMGEEDVEHVKTGEM